jgi:hypothetical protein
VIKCDFAYFLRNCVKENFTALSPKKNEQNIWTQYDGIILAQLLITIFTPIITILGCVLNFLVIYVVTHKKNQKELKEKHYKYMGINSACAMCILAIHLLDLMNSCQEPFGLYCSQIHKLAAIQYYKIIFAEFASHTLQLVSNFTYVAFALNRLALIGDKHGRLTTCASTMAVKYFTLSVVISSVILSLVKCFRYEVNSYVSTHDYPFAFQNNPFYNPSEAVTALVFITNGFVDFVNYVLFVFVDLCVDVRVAVRLKRTLKEKREKFNLKDESKKKEDDEAVTRLVHMAILYALTHLMLKLPNAITSLHDFVLISASISKWDPSKFYFNVRGRYFDFSYFAKYVCSATKICQVFGEYAQLFYLISLAFNILFFYHFDKKFNTAYNLVCGFCTKALPSTPPSKSKPQKPKI